MRGYLLLSVVVLLGVSSPRARVLIARLGEPHLKNSVAAIPIASADDGKEEQRSLEEAVERYERRPTPELVAAAWEAFARIDSQLSVLKRQVAESLGGARADAELDRLELQRWRDAQMERFSGAQRKIVSAMAALDSVSRSIASGIGDGNVGEVRPEEPVRRAPIED